MTSIILLFSLALLFSGVPGSLSAAFFKQTGKSCCEDCRQKENQSSDRCSTSDCPIFLCLAVTVDSPFELFTSSTSIPASELNQEPILFPLEHSIFHPPRVA